ncbi:TlyA family rRNA (cytidine-2'-O)-methyltransferase [Oceanidesulfovibrio indonesiensis]|uniref:TlyA family rRNA (Cytidine-2'-O)-methyltransferase n=1 Tax=Oceanidesulfovibrio indonesiensis TaxID=54767 RepID=A0A7M3MFL1_9BACT|nr:TlyA family RNA methyltransferase [Oceanidesulfovibrio indonesiensis]TVM17570.1 TlyA family rRNA (cytidine-2'-O)-methyltransferase [Oceanidesulfovibrio indonesiensis]
MAKKIRADQLAFEQGLTASREQAKRLIMAGQVLLVTGRGLAEPVPKPGHQLSPDAELLLKEAPRFVSRGGEKLATAIDAFKLDVAGLVCLDAGASTGGFTDCLLQHGAARVYAVDVGKNQLHEKLMRDDRVVAMDGVNMRYAPPDLLPEAVDLIVADLSFISLATALPGIAGFLQPGGNVVALIKPQFEVGMGRTDKGVVRDEALRDEAVQSVLAWVSSRGFAVRGCVPSRIKGPKGNQEFLAYFTLP